MTLPGLGKTTVPTVTRVIADIAAKSRLNSLIGLNRYIAGDALLSRWLAVKRDGIASPTSDSGFIGVDAHISEACIECCLHGLDARLVQ